MEHLSEVPAPAPRRPSTPLDLEELKRRQQAMWSAGDFGVIGTKILVASELRCEAVDLRAGERVLDVACGHGNTALAGARRPALATGLDDVPALLERTRERAAAERLEVAWREGDAERRTLEMRYVSGEHFLEVYRTWFGPVRTAFAALDGEGQAALAGDLLELVARVDRAGGGSVVLPSEYLEVVAVRR